MNFRMLLIISLLLGVTGCAEKAEEPAAPAAEIAMTEPDSTEATDDAQIWRSSAFREHMHVHAEKLDELNFALADGDLDMARSHANWLANHDTDSDLPSEWMPMLFAMRTEAEAVAAAPDMDAAKAAAEQITVKCQECHTAIGIDEE
jgi:soluble cytochrome b562